MTVLTSPSAGNGRAHPTHARQASREIPTALTNVSPQLRAAWHPVTTVADLQAAGNLISVLLLGERWVVTRLDGTLSAFPDVCPHRRVPLSDGRVTDAPQHLECSYHGWQFDGTGRCTTVPALGRGRRAPRGMHLTPAWGVQECYGLIWLALEEPVAPRPVFPECEDAAFTYALLPPRRTRACAGVLIDNFFDVAHFSYVHERTFGVTEPVTTETAVVTREGPWFARLVHTTRLGGADDATSRVRTATYTATAPFAMHLRLQFADAPDSSMVAFVATPEAEDSSTVYKLVAARRSDDPAELQRQIQFEIDVLEEDIAMVERVTPQLLPLDLHEELHTRADRASVELRRLLADFCATGYF